MKNLRKKLNLSKTTISNLNAIEANTARGGVPTLSLCPNGCTETLYHTCNPDECETVFCTVTCPPMCF